MSTFNRNIFFIFFFLHLFINAQNKTDKVFVGVDFGVQMSGIKPQDFVSSNYSNLVRINAGKWFNKYIGFNLGYQGRYFYTIADDVKHKYDFFSFDGLFDVKKLFSKNECDYYHLVLRTGIGLFNNYFYSNSSFHFNLGLQNNFLLWDSISLKFDLGAIIGWDIYQGNQDIIPSFSVGLVKYFKI